MHTIRKFIDYYAPYKAVFFIDLICAAFISIVDLAYPQILRTMTNTLFTKDSHIILGTLPWIALGLLIMYIIQSLCKYYVSYQGHMMGANMERDMRQQLFDHYEKLSFSYYSRNNSGQMMSKLVSDLFDIAEFAHHGPENLFISVVKIVGSFIFLFLINWRLALPLVVLVLCMFIFSFRQNQRMQETFMENRRKIGDVNSSLQDTLAGIRVVQSFANEDIEREKFRKSNHAFLISKKNNYSCMGNFMGWNLFFQGMMYLVTLVFGGWLIAHDMMNVTDLAMYALYIGIFISPIQILVELIEMMQKGLAGFRRFLDVMETEPEIVDAPDAKPLTDVKGRVCYEDVSFHYSDDETPVLSHVSFEIPAGKSIALVGPSGSGKTTICSLLPRFYDVTGGRITIDGKDVRTLGLKSLRSQIGMVQQDVYLFSGTIRENIAYGKPGASMEEIIEAAKRANIHDFIEELPDGYDTFVGERGARLSGGQKQRISIARVFLKNPPILVLDEATSALDNESERWIQQSLEELSEGRTTITIAHRLSTIRNADEIIVITEDGIAERGTHETLLKKNGIYAHYYNM
ncbi:ABC transporter ATP-binding protein [Mediterraneibacter catenae]|uniref:ABC transporter ATP-binding protein n=1 Tax=Mediterraneibacter catenae TaxID=2594882 RepID=A0A5M9I0Q5_9FIRM|nr:MULTISPECIES: ABC transporter ATP-binding protein [Mediterraneibacter]OUO28924.1 thiamine ABC transporter permease [Lachnoclostridium sp. An298]HJA19814.1 ABC transporter ATP-binding protein/permease [Candidatus Mediterraneibacter ornithocaccae]KAA8502750.1 ABC transporter ATP-binding protein [Mediterraneibacter catenae]MCF2569158.1 ABC transporter ATP-binding protein [Mediterraneibacter glycyrrhizinilyticus]MDN0061492.1 ABC transporter ATP-binding protein [Mediterraneibacter glycyrrhizinil